ncbi:hypothetical protein EG329_012944 [Mollisiaceae sp. DMI_Dod_QoI]|nr:hypothetical protein EG329_012944 [Helotiales sp. DMI_Dod_QoI]
MALRRFLIPRCYDGSFGGGGIAAVRFRTSQNTASSHWGAEERTPEEPGADETHGVLVVSCCRAIVRYILQLQIRAAGAEASPSAWAQIVSAELTEAYDATTQER